jgi:hypothetical protein
MFAAFIRLLDVSRRFLSSRCILAGRRPRPALPPGAACVLLAPFRSGPTHVV